MREAGKTYRKLRWGRGAGGLRGGCAGKQIFSPMLTGIELVCFCECARVVTFFLMKQKMTRTSSSHKQPLLCIQPLLESKQGNSDCCFPSRVLAGRVIDHRERFLNVGQEGSATIPNMRVLGLPPRPQTLTMLHDHPLLIANEMLAPPPCRATPSCPASWRWGTSLRSARLWRWQLSCLRGWRRSRT